MLVRLYTIIALLIFIILMFMGSTMEPAILKSAIVFMVLVAGTRMCTHILDIIKENASQEQGSSPTS